MSSRVGWQSRSISNPNPNPNCWGISKKYIRRHNQNSHIQAKDMIPFVSRSLSTDVIPLSLMHNFARRARSYQHVYVAIGCKGSDSYVGIENMRKQFKTHRNIEEIERVYLNQFLTSDSREFVLSVVMHHVLLLPFPPQ